MAIVDPKDPKKPYKPSKHATMFNPEVEPSMTEQEHLKSCDINVMIANAHRGQDIRMAQNQPYGYDDTTMTGLEIRIQKQNYEREMTRISETQEFTQAEFDLIPADVRARFKFKIKSEAKPNDDQTTPPTPPQSTATPAPTTPAAPVAKT